MLDHHIQRSIVYDLAFVESLRFSELKPGDLENKAFDYHLKKVIRAGFVQKREDGTYTLTPEGRRVGKGALKKQSRLLDRAYSLLLLAVRDENGAWLLYRRPTHPLLGKIGFMQAQPVADSDILVTAQTVYQEQFARQVDFSVHGHGFFRVYRESELESFIHFTLLTTQVASFQIDPSFDYFWQTDPDFSSPEMLPNMQTLHKMLQDSPGSFVEATFEL